MKPALKTTMFRLAVMLAVWTSAGVSSTPVFRAEVLISTFGSLKNRSCLPADFDFSALQPTSGECAREVNGPDPLPSECAGAMKLDLFYNCYGVGTGRLDRNATFFDIALHEKSLLDDSNDLTWRATLSKLLATCRRMSSAQLSPKQQNLYSFFCIKWSLFTDCDLQQSNKGSLDADGLLRRAKFLSGDCPLSPSSLLDAFGVVTGKTWEECSQGLYAGTDATLLYEAQVSRLSCLLQNFQTTAGKVDFSKLVDAVTAADQGHDVSTILLLKVIGDCATSGGLKAKGKNQFNSMTSAEFIKCWAQDGVFSCAQQEANQEASKYPEACNFFVEN